jgi:hypothetical protein
VANNSFTKLSHILTNSVKFFNAHVLKVCLLLISENSILSAAMTAAANQQLQPGDSRNLNFSPLLLYVMLICFTKLLAILLDKRGFYGGTIWKHS